MCKDDEKKVVWGDRSVHSPHIVAISAKTASRGESLNRTGLREGLKDPGRGVRIDIVAPPLRSPMLPPIATPALLPGLRGDAPIIVLLNFLIFLDLLTASAKVSEDSIMKEPRLGRPKLTKQGQAMQQSMCAGRVHR